MKFDGIEKLTSWPKIGEITRKDSGACAGAAETSASDTVKTAAAVVSVRID